ncbi:hypothetical protein HJFPF1_10018 [Paramyrothecium foliicola]|nr:hypothetical protein HJFPF1_10018 [Paramyrothecium foliicola]
MLQLGFQVIGVDQPLLASESEFYYRIRLDNGKIKYLAYYPGRNLETPVLADRLGDRIATRTVPDGDWNVAYLEEAAGDMYKISGYAPRRHMMGITNTSWCPQRVDWFAIRNIRHDYEDFQCSPDPCRSFICDNPFGTGLAILHFDWHPDGSHYLNKIVDVYSQIRRDDLAPKFLGFVHENQGERIIGFVVEKVDGRCARRGAVDQEQCIGTLAKLHSMNYLLGGSQGRETFLWRPDGTAILHDFSSCTHMSKYQNAHEKARAMETERSLTERHLDATYWPAESETVEVKDQMVGEAISLLVGAAPR